MLIVVSFSMLLSEAAEHCPYFSLSVYQDFCVVSAVISFLEGKKENVLLYLLNFLSNF